MNNVTTIARVDGESHTEGIEPKWLPRYLGPFKVLEVTGGGSLNRRLELPRDLQTRLTKDTFHVSKLKKATDKGSTLDLSSTIPPPTVGEGESEEHYIEEVMGHVDDHITGRKFLLKAVGFDDPADYWLESMDNCGHIEELIEQYFKKTPRQIIANKKDAAAASTKGYRQKSARTPKLPAKLTD